MMIWKGASAATAPYFKRLVLHLLELYAKSRIVPISNACRLLRHYNKRHQTQMDPTSSRGFLSEAWYGIYVILPRNIENQYYCWLPICISAMSYPHYHYSLFLVVNFINYAIFSDTDPPIILWPHYFTATCRSWIFGQSSDIRDNAVKIFGRKAL